jgi:hypothetical protein
VPPVLDDAMQVSAIIPRGEAGSAVYHFQGLSFYPADDFRFR